MTTHTHNNEVSLAELESTEKALKASEAVLMRAQANKGVYEKQLEENNNELKALGTTPEEAQRELEAIDEKMRKLLDEINAMIPYDLLRAWNQI